MVNFGFGDRNDRGERQVQYFQYENMSIGNTSFKKTLNRKWNAKLLMEHQRSKLTTYSQIKSKQ